MPANEAHFDGNQVATMTGVIGTLGTADVKGTALTLPVSIDSADGGMNVHVLSGGSGGGGTTVTVDHGTISVNSIPQVSVGTIPNTPGGTLALVTTLSNLTNGTVRVSLGTTVAGTLNLVTTVSNLSAGSINVIAGTTTAGTLNLLTRAGNVGTIESGTIKLNPKNIQNIITFATVSAGTIGTIVAAPSAGSAVYVNDVAVSSYNGTAEVLVSYGLSTSGNSVLLRGRYGAQGGHERAFPQAVNGGGVTGSAVTWNILEGSGTISYMISYWVEVP